MGGTVRLLLFAGAREAVGRGSLELPVAPHGETAADLLAPIARDHPAFRRVLATSRLVHNGEFVSGQRFTCRPGDELAVHPPYSGG